MFDEAAEQYDRALRLHRLPFIDRVRILDKFSMASVSSANPTAFRLPDSVLDSSVQDGKAANLAVDTLWHTARRLWLECRTVDSLDICSKSVHIAQSYDSAPSLQLATIRYAGFLKDLGRFEESLTYLESLTGIERTGGAVRALYLSCQGDLASHRGEQEKAYESFESSLSLATDESTDLGAILGDYAFASMRLGNIERELVSICGGILRSCLAPGNKKTAV